MAHLVLTIFVKYHFSLNVFTPPITATSLTTALSLVFCLVFQVVEGGEEVALGMTDEIGILGGGVTVVVVVVTGTRIATGGSVGDQRVPSAQKPKTEWATGVAPMTRALALAAATATATAATDRLASAPPTRWVRSAARTSRPLHSLELPRRLPQMAWVARRSPLTHRHSSPNNPWFPTLCLHLSHSN